MSPSEYRVRVATNVIIGAAILGCLVLLLAPPATALDLTREWGPLENLSLGIAACGTLVASVQFLRTRSSIWISVTLLVFWMFLRELDYQRLFTPRSVESIGFYFSPEVALSTKLLALAAYSPFAAAGGHLAWLTLNSLRATSAPGSAFWRPLIFAGILLSVARASEKLLRSRGQIVEELFELAFACLIFLAVVSQSTARRPHQIKGAGCCP